MKNARLFIFDASDFLRIFLETFAFVPGTHNIINTLNKVFVSVCLVGRVLRSKLPYLPTSIDKSIRYLISTCLILSLPPCGAFRHLMPAPLSSMDKVPPRSIPACRINHALHFNVWNRSSLSASLSSHSHLLTRIWHTFLSFRSSITAFLRVWESFI